MGPVSGDQDVVARTKITLTFALNAETRRAGEEQDPFVMSLTMWFIHRRGLTSRDDPLDTHVLPRKKLGEDLPVYASRKVIEKIDHEPSFQSVGDGFLTSVLRAKFFGGVMLATQAFTADSTFQYLAAVMRRFATCIHSAAARCM
jgi:hypothetical protein